jgi:hypothetical protein
LYYLVREFRNHVNAALWPHSAAVAGRVMQPLSATSRGFVGRAARSNTRINARHRQFASTFFHGDETNTRLVRAILPPAEMSFEVHRSRCACVSREVFLEVVFPESVVLVDGVLVKAPFSRHVL